MKIVHLYAENIKKLKAVEIRPDGQVVTIAGRNGAGKTSVLDAIWLALDHVRVEASMPIRQGETKARVRLNLGEIVVERRFNEAGSQLIVENEKGARFPSPQKMLDELLGHLSFDPLAFSRMAPRAQFDELRRVAQVDMDLEEVERLNAGDFGKRTDVNRDAKTKRAQAEGIKFPADTPEVLVDVAALVDELEQAGKHNAEIETRKARRQAIATEGIQAAERAKVLRTRAAEMRAELERVEAEAASLDQEVDTIRQRLADAPELPPARDTAELRAAIDKAETTNRHVALRDQKAKLLAEVVALEGQARSLTERIQARDDAKAAALASAAMPVEGLGLGDGIVVFNGIPLDQASSAEQLRVSLAIAMAANPKIRVIRIQDGSLLDDDGMAAIAEMAREKDYQVWVERVATDGKVGIVIEDGMVKGADVAEAAE